MCIRDRFLEESLELAVKNMKNAGYELQNNVSIEIDSELQFMGYAKIDSNNSSIVVADWALDSDMLNGLILHELAHIYFTEINSPSHQSDIINEVMSHVVEQEGLNNLDSIMEVNGIHVLFLGPYDISQSLGVPGDVRNPIVEKALKQNTGARALRTIMEDILLDLMYEIPSIEDAHSCVISKEVAEKKILAALVDDNGNELDWESIRKTA